MKTQTIVYVTDMARSVEFYSRLGFKRAGPAGDYWTAFAAGTETLALHRTEAVEPNAGSVTLSLVSEEPLDELAGTLAEKGITSSEITEQPFGRSFTITDPDGLIIQVNEHST